MVEEAGSKARLYPCIGEALSYTKDMPPSEWVEAISMALRAKAQEFLVFAEPCIEKAKAWEAIREYFKTLPP